MISTSGSRFLVQGLAFYKISVLLSSKSHFYFHNWILMMSIAKACARLIMGSWCTFERRKNERAEDEEAGQLRPDKTRDPSLVF